MRGKDEFHMQDNDKLRITPAYAGKSIVAYASNSST